MLTKPKFATKSNLYVIYIFHYAPVWILWYVCFSVCSWVDFMMFMPFSMLPDGFYDIYVFQNAPGWILYYRFLYTHAYLFDWPRSICSWMNVIIFIYFSMLLDEIYDIYVFNMLLDEIISVFQYAPWWNVWYLCLSVSSWLKFMILMFFILLLDELYNIYVVHYAPVWILYLWLSVYICNFFRLT